MADEYTPTTDDIRVGRPKGWFDRWLAQHDAEVKAEALEEAAKEVQNLYFGGGATGSANRWGAKEAAKRLRHRAEQIRKGAS